jgi:hypothetical protein
MEICVHVAGRLCRRIKWEFVDALNAWASTRDSGSVAENDDKILRAAADGFDLAARAETFAYLCATGDLSAAMLMFDLFGLTAGDIAAFDFLAVRACLSIGGPRSVADWLVAEFCQADASPRAGAPLAGWRRPGGNAGILESPGGLFWALCRPRGADYVSWLVQKLCLCARDVGPELSTVVVDPARQRIEGTPFVDEDVWADAVRAVEFGPDDRRDMLRAAWRVGDTAHVSRLLSALCESSISADAFDLSAASPDSSATTPTPVELCAKQLGRHWRRRQLSGESGPDWRIVGEFAPATLWLVRLTGVSCDALDRLASIDSADSTAAIEKYLEAHCARPAVAKAAAAVAERASRADSSAD